MEKDAIEIYDKILNNPAFRESCNTQVRTFPEAFVTRKESVRAIVIGADPTNPSNRIFNYDFGLEEGARSAYFRTILKNLSFIGLGLDDIYVQNLCKNYFKEVTNQNLQYNEIARKYWLALLKTELSFFDHKIPVLVTAWKPLVVIAPKAVDFEKNKKHIYEGVVVFGKENELERPVAALFRRGNGYYSLEKEKWSKYMKRLRDLI